MAKKTHDDYAHMSRRHLIPALSRLKLHKLTAEHLDELYAKKRTDDGLSARTVGYIHSTIRVALQRAVKKRLVPYNVARDADPPPIGDAGEEKTVLTMGQLSDFFRAAAETEDRFEAFFVVGALAGPRPQELLGLKWQDLTLPEVAGKPGAMEIRRRVSSSSAGLEILDGTKGSRGKKRADAQSTSCPRLSPP